MLVFQKNLQTNKMNDPVSTDNPVVAKNARYP